MTRRRERHAGASQERSPGGRIGVPPIRVRGETSLQGWKAQDATAEPAILAIRTRSRLAYTNIFSSVMISVAAGKGQR
jgi:hypothetical protein